MHPGLIDSYVKNFIKKKWLIENQTKRADYIQGLLKTYPDEISTENFTSFNTKDAVVWIDPLDGTSDFVKGNLPACTVLIGLSIN